MFISHEYLQAFCVLSLILRYLQVLHTSIHVPIEALLACLIEIKVKCPVIGPINFIVASLLQNSQIRKQTIGHFHGV